MKGQIVKGRVVNVVDFGLFVDLDGVDGLVHVSELDWVRVENMQERYKPGDELELQILDVDIERERVTLSRKSLITNPWEKMSERYKPGDVIRCKVARVLDFGAFVELPEGVQGLIPKNELGYTHTSSPKEAVKVGETVLAIVLSVDEEGGRMALSMRQVPREKQIEWLLTSQDDQAMPSSPMLSSPGETSLEDQPDLPVEESVTDQTSGEDTGSENQENEVSAPSGEEEPEPPEGNVSFI